MTDDLRFSPETITISAGDSVRWLNASRTWHTVTTDYRMAKDPKNVNLPVNAEPFNSGKIDPGGTWSYQFMLPGTYRYFCIYHEEQGMVGEIVVSPRVTGQ
jgi:plastocyanin